MAIRFSTFLAITTATVLLTGGVADAQTTRRAPAPKVQASKAHHPVIIAEMSDATAKPLVIQKRSFLDPGTASTPALGQPEYFAAQTSDYVPVYATYNTAAFGESELPRGNFNLPNDPSRFPTRNIDFSPLWRGLD